MQFLVDTSEKKMSDRFGHSELVAGQLLTPLTRYANWGGSFAIDNGAFSRFHADAFCRLIERNEPHKSDCLFVTVPDIVGNGRRTLEVFRFRDDWVPSGWPIALVAQDGMEDLDVPWHDFHCLFIGGCDPWKDSQSAIDLVKTAKTIGLHVHVGRVNMISRFRRFADAGADTCDGSGVARYDHMLEGIERALNGEPVPTLFAD